MGAVVSIEAVPTAALAAAQRRRRSLAPRWLRTLHRRFAPSHWRRHRGLALVMLATIQLHLWAAADALLPEAGQRHSAAVFRVMNRMGPVWLWGLLHLALAVLGIVGVYITRRASWPVRLAAGLSTATFTVLMGSFAAAVFIYWPQASLLGIGMCCFVALTCAAATLEPLVNPISALRARARRRE